MRKLLLAICLLGLTFAHKTLAQNNTWDDAETIFLTAIPRGIPVAIDGETENFLNNLKNDNTRAAFIAKVKKAGAENRITLSDSVFWKNDDQVLGDRDEMLEFTTLNPGPLRFTYCLFIDAGIGNGLGTGTITFRYTDDSENRVWNEGQKPVRGHPNYWTDDDEYPDYSMKNFLSCSKTTVAMMQLGIYVPPWSAQEIYGYIKDPSYQLAWKKMLIAKGLRITKTGNAFTVSNGKRTYTVAMFDPNGLGVEFEPRPVW